MSSENEWILFIFILAVRICFLVLYRECSHKWIKPTIINHTTYTNKFGRVVMYREFKAECEYCKLKRTKEFNR